MFSIISKTGFTIWVIGNPLPNDKFSKLTKFPDDKSKFDENCVKYSNWEEKLWKRRNCSINCSPNNKILDLTKLKASADDKLNVAKMMFSLLDRVENTAGKGENAPFPTVFS